MLEYNSITKPRTQKASVSSAGRDNAVGFAIVRMGYFGLGRNSSNTKLSDFWMYDQANNTWTQKGSFRGGARTYLSGTSTGGYGYIVSERKPRFLRYACSKNACFDKLSTTHLPQ